MSSGHVIMITAALLAGLLNFLLLSSDDDAVSVVVAAADIEAGRLIGPADVEYLNVGAEAANLPGITTADTVESVVGSVALRRIGAGNLVLADSVASDTAFVDERLRMSLELDRARAVGGLLRAGDSIDVITVGPDGLAEFAAVAVPVEGVTSPESGFGVGSGTVTITVAVDRSQAVRLAAAAATGEIHVLRATGTSVSEPLPVYPPVPHEEPPP